MTAPHYVSTRNPNHRVSFRDALLTGLAPDGGLYIPAEIPSVPSSAWASPQSVASIGADVLPHWIGSEVPAEDLSAIARDALNFPAPVVPLCGPGWERTYVLELFHGPTLSFKDFGARTMARMMAHFLRGRDEPLTILVATSGDTGSAVADGFAGLPGIRVVLLFPKGQVSALQERQLIVKRPGVQALAVRGTFDDCQRLVKQAFTDPALSHISLSSANSINVGRLLPQMLYYMWAAARIQDPEVVFCVPSGNLGNLTGGVLAALSGLPVARFIAAHNANDFFPRFLGGGADEFPDSVRTLSNAMDVGAPSNFERLRALLIGSSLRERIWAASVSDEETLESMRRVYDETGYVADPHTAVGLEGARRFREVYGTDRPIVVLSTAHPAKFPDVVQKAIGRKPDVPEPLAALWAVGTAVEEVEPARDALNDYLVARTEA